MSELYTNEVIMQIKHLLRRNTYTTIEEYMEKQDNFVFM